MIKPYIRVSIYITSRDVLGQSIDDEFSISIRQLNYNNHKSHDDH